MASAPSDLSAYSGTWSLDPALTSVEFHTKAMWVLKVKGTLKAIEGTGSVGPNGEITGTVVLDASSVDTGNKKRDTHLRTADFFEVDSHPTMTFTATGAEPQPDGTVKVTGDLTIHGQTRPLTVTAKVSESAKGATVTAEADIDRSEWGLTWAKMGAGVANHVVVSASFVKA